MSQITMFRLSFAVSLVLAFGGGAFANTLQFASQVSEIKVVELLKLPIGPVSLQDEYYRQCSNSDDEINSAAGKVVAAKNWLVTSEVQRAGLTFVSFVGSVEPGTSGSCKQNDGNVGIFRGESLLGIVYADKTADRTIGRIQALEGNRLRIWDGSDLKMPLADLDIIGGDLVIVRNVSNRDSFCGGSSSAPNIFNLPIHLARQVLFSEGWETGPVPPEADNMSLERRKLLPELDTCSGTGFGYCAYTYRKEPEQIIRVITVGEPDWVVSFSVQCGADIQ